jgi:hypothetical protein
LGAEVNSPCSLTAPPPSLAGRSEFTMSRSPPPIQPFVQNNLEINSDMKSALDRPPVHKICYLVNWAGLAAGLLAMMPELRVGINSWS